MSRVARSSGPGTSAPTSALGLRPEAITLPASRYAPGEQFSVVGENFICIVFSVCPVFEIKDALPESDCAL